MVMVHIKKIYIISLSKKSVKKHTTKIVVALITAVIEGLENQW